MLVALGVVFLGLWLDLFLDWYSDWYIMLVFVVGNVDPNVANVVADAASANRRLIPWIESFGLAVIIPDQLLVE